MKSPSSSRMQMSMLTSSAAVVELSCECERDCNGIGWIDSIDSRCLNRIGW